MGGLLAVDRQESVLFLVGKLLFEMSGEALIFLIEGSKKLILVSLRVSMKKEILRVTSDKTKGKNT